MIIQTHGVIKRWTSRTCLLCESVCFSIMLDYKKLWDEKCDYQWHVCKQATSFCFVLWVGHTAGTASSSSCTVHLLLAATCLLTRDTLTVQYPSCSRHTSLVTQSCYSPQLGRDESKQGWFLPSLGCCARVWAALALLDYYSYQIIVLRQITCPPLLAWIEVSLTLRLTPIKK